MATPVLTMNAVTLTETHVHLTIVEILEVITEQHVAADTLHHTLMGTPVQIVPTTMVPLAPLTHIIAVPIIAVHTQMEVTVQAEAVTVVVAIVVVAAAVQ